MPSCSPVRGRLGSQPPPWLPARDRQLRAAGVRPGAGLGWAGPGCEILEGGGAAAFRAARGLGRLGGAGLFGTGEAAVGPFVGSRERRPGARSPGWGRGR